MRYIGAELPERVRVTPIYTLARGGGAIVNLLLSRVQETCISEIPLTGLWQ